MPNLGAGAILPISLTYNYYQNKKMKTLTVTIAFLLIVLSAGSTFASIAGTPESEAASIQVGFFNIKYFNETSILSWTTPNTVSGAAFTVERSEDGKVYTEIGKVNATGISNFSFVDYKPVDGINYYRFKRVDAEGKLTISPVRVVITEKDSPFKIRPALDKSSITLKSQLVCSCNTSVKVVSLKTGSVELETTLVADTKELELNVSNFPAGGYVIKMEVEGKVYNQSFVKQ